MDHAVFALHQNDLFVRCKRFVFVIDGFKGDDLILRQHLGAAVDDLDLQTVVRHCVAVAGESVAIGEENAHTLQKLRYRLTIRGGGGFHPAVDDGDGLQALDGDVLDTVGIGSRIGILRAQRDSGLVQNGTQIAAEGAADRHVFSVGDDVAGLRENDEGKHTREYGNDQDDQQHPIENAVLRAFFGSVHQSDLLSD